MMKVKSVTTAFFNQKGDIKVYVWSSLSFIIQQLLIDCFCCSYTFKQSKVSWIT